MNEGFCCFFGKGWAEVGYALEVEEGYFGDEFNTLDRGEGLVKERRL